MARRIWCDYESDWFDSNEFVNTAEYGQVHEKAGAGIPRHTTAGSVIAEEGSGTGTSMPPWAEPW